MQAIILAAGRGSRLAGSPSAKPKCLTRLGGRSLLSWQEQALKSAGIDKIGIVVGHKAAEVPRNGGPVFLNDRWAKSGVVSSLLEARDWLQRETTIVAYGDVIYSSQTVEQMTAKEGDIVIPSYERWRELWELRFDNPLDDAESFKVDSNGRLLEIGHREADIEEIAGQFMGLAKVTPAGWSVIFSYCDSHDMTTIDSLDFTSLLSSLIETGAVIGTFVSNGLWYEIDTPRDVALFADWLSILRRMPPSQEDE